MEKVTIEKFSWPYFFKLETISNEKWTEAKEHASHWKTCAVGQQSYKIPKDINGCPFDFELAQLGMVFKIAIISRKFEKAGAIYQQIIDRANTVIDLQKRKQRLNKPIQ